MSHRTIRMHRSFRVALAASLAALAGVADPGLATDEPLDERSSYSYVRTMEGRATLTSLERGESESADRHEPLLAGDTIRVERGARLEIVLADRNLLRIGGDSSVRLAAVAFSADADSRATQLELEQGEIELVVSDQALGDELPEIRTPAGTVFVHEPGRYRLFSSPTGALEVTVRQGFAELLTEHGSTVVRSGEEAWVSADRWRSVQVGTSGPLGALERWGLELEQRVARASSRELRVAPYLAYSAADLDDYGSWIYVDASWYWRPRVATGWRPFWDGRWVWTPTGLTWVSYEPWGWVPYHYGTWTVVPGYGWAWRPGRVYSPAWVYWYVGPAWTGWCPIGYYTSHYRGYWQTGFRFGIYGWTGGGWGIYADWNFLPTPHVYSRDGRRWRHTGSHLGRNEKRPPAPGILTTDTRRLPRRNWDRPDEIVRTLARRPTPGDRDRGLPEVTDFVARRPQLPREVASAVLQGPTGGRTNRHASPLDPGAPRREEAPTLRTWQERRESNATSRRLEGGEMFRSDAPGRNSTVPQGSFGTERGTTPRPRTGGSADAAVRGRGIEPSDRQGWRRRLDAPPASTTPPPGAEWGRRSRPAGGNESPAARVIDGARRIDREGLGGRSDWRVVPQTPAPAERPPRATLPTPRFGNPSLGRPATGPNGQPVGARPGVVSRSPTPTPPPGARVQPRSPSTAQRPANAGTRSSSHASPPPKARAPRGKSHGGSASPPPKRQAKSKRDHD